MSGRSSIESAGKSLALLSLGASAPQIASSTSATTLPSPMRWTRLIPSKNRLPDLPSTAHECANSRTHFEVDAEIADHERPAFPTTGADRVAREGRREGSSAVAPAQQPQPQRVELDEARRVALVVGAGVVLEGHDLLRIERVGRLAADDDGRRPCRASAGRCRSTFSWLWSIAACSISRSGENQKPL